MKLAGGGTLGPRAGLLTERRRAGVRAELVSRGPERILGRGTGCGRETACAYYDGGRKLRLCPECLGRIQEDPRAREILLGKGPSRAN